MPTLIPKPHGTKHHPHYLLYQIRLTLDVLSIGKLVGLQEGQGDEPAKGDRRVHVDDAVLAVIALRLTLMLDIKS